MAFDWTAFLDDRGIDYKSQRKDVYIHCPFCGESDHGQHMGISVDGRGWGCWRNQAHRGRNPQKLVQALLGCSWGEAGRLVGNRASGQLWGAGDALEQMLDAFIFKKKGEQEALRLPKQFVPLHRNSMGGAYYDYLKERGFSQTLVDYLAMVYHLHTATSGDWTYRIILPIHDLYGNLVTWTGRAINDAPKIKYKTLHANPSKVEPGEAIAQGPITDHLLGLPELTSGGRFLIVTEGPFDVLNLALDARKWQAQVTCLFGKAVSDAQLDLLQQLRKAYDAIYLVLDPDAAFDAMRLGDRLAVAGVVPVLLTGAHDPGEMNADERDRLFKEMERATKHKVQPFANSRGLP